MPSGLCGPQLQKVLKGEVAVSLAVAVMGQVWEIDVHVGVLRCLGDLEDSVGAVQVDAPGAKILLHIIGVEPLAFKVQLFGDLLLFPQWGHVASWELLQVPWAQLRPTSLAIHWTHPFPLWGIVAQRLPNGTRGLARARDSD